MPGPDTKRRWRVIAFRAGQWIFAIAVIVLAFRALNDQWGQVKERIVTLEFDWLIIGFASILVLGIYAALVEAWRRMLGAWDRMLSFGTATRIWFASSLGKYIPGYIWSLTAMGVMVRQQGLSGLAGAGASVVVNVLNLASGIAITVLCGSKILFPNWVAALILVLIVAGAVIAPAVLPVVTRLVGRITGKQMPIPHISAATVWTILGITTVAWIGYGIAFYLFAIAVLGEDAATQASLSLYIAVYTGAYMIGLISPPPAGIGAREGGLIKGMTEWGSISAADAFVLAITSRFWLTILELLPAFIALLISQRTPLTPSSNHHSQVTTHD